MAEGNFTDLPSAIKRGGYVARFAACADDVLAAQKLRYLCFIEAAGLAARKDGIEADTFDSVCDHVLIEDDNGEVVCCFRVLALGSGAALNTSYSAQYYNLENLFVYPAPMVELGRFCIHPKVKDADVLRIAWGMLAAFVDVRGADMLFGCASFEGTQPQRYRAAFDLLAAQHLAPDQWMPGIKAREIVAFAVTARPVLDRRVALGQVPSLLKTYLTMGGWVSDHAVIDRDLNTLHVFTALEISAVPTARAAALRAVLI